MSDSKQPQSQALRIDDQFIAEYLQENPHFFDAHPELLSHMRVRHQQQGSVSLVERQQLVLREKVAALEEEITTLMANARRNEFIFECYSELYQQLLNCTSLDDLEQALHHTFIGQLGLVDMSLKLFVPTALEHLAFNADTHKHLVGKRFDRAPVYFGRLPADEQKLVFRANAQPVESVALLLLGENTKYGLLALGSRDASHFEPNMDHLLISQLQALLTQVLPRLVA